MTALLHPSGVRSTSRPVVSLGGWTAWICVADRSRSHGHNPGDVLMITEEPAIPFTHVYPHQSGLRARGFCQTISRTSYVVRRCQSAVELVAIVEYLSETYDGRTSSRRHHSWGSSSSSSTSDFRLAPKLPISARPLGSVVSKRYADPECHRSLRRPDPAIHQVLDNVLERRACFVCDKWQAQDKAKWNAGFH